MESLYKGRGKIRAIGVSNFSPDDLDNILNHCEIVPHVNQIAYFIGLRPKKQPLNTAENTISWLKRIHRLGLVTYLKTKTSLKTAEKYQVSPAQICIRYCLTKRHSTTTKINA